MSRRAFVVLIVIAGVIVFNFIGAPGDSPAIWQVSAGGEIPFRPARVGDEAFFVAGETSLFKIDVKGKLTGPVSIPNPLKHPLVGVGSTVVAIDRNARLTAFAADDLRVLWRVDLVESPKWAPLVGLGNTLLIGGSLTNIFCLNAATGEKVWDTVFPDSVSDIALGRTLGVIHGSIEPRKSTWKLSGLDPETGEILWSFPREMSGAYPLPRGSVFVVCDGDGKPCVIDQETGTEIGTISGNGYKMVEVAGDRFFLLAAGGSRLESVSLKGGSAFGTTLPSPLSSLWAFEDRALAVDGKSIKALRLKSGEVIWKKELGKTFGLAHRLRNGVGITYKDDFISRPTYYSIFSARDGNPIWTCSDYGIFHFPFVFPEGDMVFCRTGNIRLMGDPVPFEPLAAQFMDNRYGSDENPGISPASGVSPIPTETGTSPIPVKQPSPAASASSSSSADEPSDDGTWR